MRKTPNLDVERFRVRHGQFASSRPDGNNGQFFVPLSLIILADRVWALCMVSDGEGWEHVSVSVYRLGLIGERLPLNRCPTWEEMCRVKDLFWESEECVIQFHPRASEYRNLHPYVLHLWRPTDARIPEPNADFVAPKPGETVDDAIARFKESA
jgi:hypothetical protein